MKAVIDRFLNRPALLRDVAAVLWWSACVALTIGLIAAAINAILAVLAATSGTVPATFESLAGPLPTWWVPQSVPGVAAYLTAMLVAYMLNEIGRELQRMLRT